MKRDFFLLFVIRLAFRKLKYLYFSFLSKRKIMDILKDREKIFLEIGAGEKKGEKGWITLDMNKKCDLYWDLRRGIPFPDKSIYMIYSSHLFEHLTFKEIELLLNECRRVLISGGIFSICVPNARLYIEAYMQKNDEYWTSKNSFWEPAFNDTTEIDYINYIAYMGEEHKYMFDEENLVFLLKRNGFNDVSLRNFDSSLDLLERDHESIYASAIK